MLLGVNIDHIATLRNARGGFEPDLIRAARLCERNGADSITVHLREDRRHIKDDDVYRLKKVLKTRLNLEMAMTEEMQKIALDVLPDSVCIVPENRMELTTEGGLDVASRTSAVKDFIEPLLKAKIKVSLFIDPDINQVSASFKAGAPFIELHTGTYSNSFKGDMCESEFTRLKEAAVFANTLKMKVNAGHGLDYENVLRMNEISPLHELNIGHSIVSRSVFTGLQQAVREMKELING